MLGGKTGGIGAAAAPAAAAASAYDAPTEPRFEDAPAW